MIDTPSGISREQLEELGIRVTGSDVIDRKG
jgi:hypothetical protein